MLSYYNYYYCICINVINILIVENLVFTGSPKKKIKKECLNLSFKF